MPAIQPENNTADDATTLPWRWMEVWEDNRYREYLPEIQLANMTARAEGREYNPECAPDFSHGVAECVVCGGDSWCDDDRGRIVLAPNFTMAHRTRQWGTEILRLAPVHLQCVQHCEGHSEHIDQNLFNDYDDEFCEPCNEDRSSCDYRRCDVTDWSDNMVWDEQDEAHYCDYHYRVVMSERDDDEESDYDDDYSGRGPIQNYSFRPAPLFRLIADDDTILSWNHARETSPVRNQPYLGFELETNFRGEYNEQRRLNQAGAQFLLDAHEPNYLYIKEDGSISGFEIVSHPATVDAHKRLIKLDALRTLATEYKQSSWSSVGGTGAGLHVHISKNSFLKPSHIQRFQMFHDTNKAVIKKFAGRDSNRWATFERDQSTRMIDLSRGRQQYNRYSALNFQNSSTIELRYFRGSLEGTTLLGVLEFVHSVWKYTQVIHAKEISDGNIRWDRYRNWLLDEHDNLGFTHLLPLMDKRGV